MRLPGSMKASTVKKHTVFKERVEFTDTDNELRITD